MRGRVLVMEQDKVEDRIREVDPEVADILQCKLLPLLCPRHPHYCYCRKQYVSRIYMSV